MWSIRPNIAPASEAIFSGLTSQRDCTANNNEPVLMERVAEAAASAIPAGSSSSFFLRIHCSRGICWKRQSNITELAESCTYWTSLSLVGDDDGNDPKCDNNKDQARKTCT